ncbi:uncharacterized protein LOC120629637 [Pararge aegeria]|uniref:uncharacterized protein LOC120629637 n=1 Tax=Pararge aegeria TaxID=116150 RepID=UPI0019D141C9|nr:uncharacterized protein LOC120629637 [Pararge aegeria]
MMEHAAQIKRDEEYPLLKVESGSGDNVMKAQVPSTIPASGWHVTCTSKQFWCSRWPEFVYACWMTTILLAISFLVFYALGMSTYRRNAVVIVRCNDSKPASDVFYHHIIPRDAYVPYSLFSEYLSYMATHYPFLRFNVYFLIDDSGQNTIQDSGHTIFFERLMPQITGPFNRIFGQNYKRELKDFQRRYENVNINVMYLTKYMATTPLRYKWKTFSSNHLSFFARIYAVWQNGGIGFDLTTFNNQFNHNQAIDHRLDAILKQHNNGIKSEKYADTFNYLDNQDQNELFSMFFNMINQILNETSSFFGADSPDIKVINNTPVLRTQRSKREILNNHTATVNVKVKLGNHSTNDNVNETSKISVNLTSLSNKINISKDNNNTSNGKVNDEVINPHEVLQHDLLKIPNVDNFNADNMPHVLLFYDIYGFSDDIGPSYSFPKYYAPADPVSIKKPLVKSATQPMQRNSNYLSLTPEGHFVAASSRHHPFLAQLFSSGCQRVSPQFAIKNTLLNQCSGVRDDIYCENIRLIYNVE